jgi:hypothetical protein
MTAHTYILDLAKEAEPPADGLSHAPWPESFPSQRL